jgi:hypothetical protein
MGTIFTLRNATIGALALGMTVVAAGTASAQSRAYCDRYATDYANDVADPGAEALRGGVGGALFGAGVGAIVGGGKGAGRGAIIGGGVGTFAGAANASAAWRRAYDRAYGDCMRSNARYDGGRRERPVRAAAPEPGSPEWYDYCSAKYRSFNPDTGYYRGYDGQYHLCR